MLTFMPAYTKPEKRKNNRVVLNVDLGADLSGFRSARQVTPAHRRILKHYASPLLAGPPPSDDLLELVTHLYTEDEAELVQYLLPLWPRTAETVAAKARRPVAEVKTILDHLAFTKHVIMAGRTPRRYGIMPIVPGTFEMALMTTDLTTRNAWHRKFAQIFERLWESGFLADYARTTKSPIRYLPVASIGKNLTSAWPSDLLEEVFEPYDDFAVGNCQCRTAMRLVENGCKRETETCVGFGPLSKSFVEMGLMRKAGKQEVLDIKHRAEKEGSVTFLGNEMGDHFGNVTCSCCGCCCHALRTLSDFNAPGMISKPHFRPRLNQEKCTILCKKCVHVCPVDAWSVVEEKLQFDTARCIGCGLCASSCHAKALELTPVLDAEKPGKGWLDLLIKMAPGYASLSAQIWAKRLLGDSPGNYWSRLRK